ncbi:MULTISPECIES: indole-3-glycerol phosphate synthase TrpC [Cytobacillus]|uniref:Indole-3-glycerol phosphate synthase n=1 Tax=Cytobacillus stercorigallinarum TaxID=2762240 RepID=A0ABR8QVU4_9BACI|nr:indole-3-glycerol phosphate synthase TrpC [Cytobacillus stercorigallinarum]MBD7939623.1 indole-3-glycerol phosphate synthase TrpC [Cytobacillus stercorigallinarum]
MTILDRIISEKRRTLSNLSYSENSQRDGTARSLLKQLEKSKPVIIAEFKRASPSKGVINNQLQPNEQACLYERFGAHAMSVLTDTPFFKGTFTDLTTVFDAVSLPLLCKDFIIDERQIVYAKNHGATVILLIVAALTKEELYKLYHYAINEGLEVLVEVHNKAEAERAIELGAEIIGVNNRNLHTFDVDLEVTESLAPLIKESGAFLISESGLKTGEDVARVIHAGADGILVGEALMTSENLELLMRQMKKTENLAGGSK